MILVKLDGIVHLLQFATQRMERVSLRFESKADEAKKKEVQQ